VRIVREVEELRRYLPPEGTCFVPTMGNLHSGHLSLVREARLHSDCVVASIFVNRLQFGPHEDFDRYPRTFSEDCSKLESAGAHVLFAPDEAILYPEPQTVLVTPPPLANELEGKFRPGFFHGVATVVLKLFNCVRPATAIFGKKDYQQLLVIKTMVKQLNVPVSIVGSEIVRDSDGLALSSRNTYLSATDRREAPALYAALHSAARRIGDDPLAAKFVCEETSAELAHRGWQCDYVEARRSIDLTLPRTADENLVLLAAARIGSTRLIDNIEIPMAASRTHKPL